MIINMQRNVQQFLRSKLARYYRYDTIDVGYSVSQIFLRNLVFELQPIEIKVDSKERITDPE